MKYGISLKIEDETYLFYVKTGTGRHDWTVSIHDAHTYKTLNGCLKEVVRLEDRMGMDAYGAVHVAEISRMSVTHVNPW